MASINFKDRKELEAYKKAKEIEEVIWGDTQNFPENAVYLETDGEVITYFDISQNKFVKAIIEASYYLYENTDGFRILVINS